MFDDWVLGQCMALSINSSVFYYGCCCLVFNDNNNCGCWSMPPDSKEANAFPFLIQIHYYSLLPHLSVPLFLLKYDRGNSSSNAGFWTFWSECSKSIFGFLTITTRCDYDVGAYYLLILCFRSMSSVCF